MCEQEEHGGPGGWGVGTGTFVWIYTDPAKQCAAVTTQRGDNSEPPHTCRPPCCRLTCQGQSSM